MKYLRKTSKDVQNKPKRQNADYRLDNVDYVNLLPEDSMIANYNVMCQILQQPVVSSNAKAAQHKEWRRYFDFEKIGQKYHILEVYDNPLSRPFTRNDVYISVIQSILTSMLADRPGVEVVMTRKELFKALGAVNDYYNEACAQIEARSRSKSKMPVENMRFSVSDAFKSEYELDYNMLEMFFDSANTYIGQIVSRALDSLQRVHLLIRYSTRTYIVEDVNGNELHREATKDEEAEIVATERHMLAQLGCADMHDVIRRFKTKEFFNKIKSNLAFTHPEWKYTYRAYRIIYDQQCMQDADQPFRHKAEGMLAEYEHRKVLNDRVYDRMTKSIGYSDAVTDPEEAVVRKQQQLLLDMFVKLPENKATRNTRFKYREMRFTDKEAQ